MKLQKMINILIKLMYIKKKNTIITKFQKQKIYFKNKIN